MPVSPRGWALVTGASAGIGAEVALRLARRGHDLVVVARRGDRLAALADQARSWYGVQVHEVIADISREDGLAAVRGVLDALPGPLDVAVLNAGTGSQGALACLDRAREADQVRLNCVAVTDLTAHVLPGMLERGRGQLVVVSSAAAAQPIPYMATYAATKGFELGLVRALHEELRGTRVRVLAICPGPVRTAFHRQGWGSDLPWWMPSESAGSCATRIVRALNRPGRGPVVRTGPVAPITMPLVRILPVGLVTRGAGLLHRAREHA